ncbi:MAG TPA: YdjY domain-containing protein [Tepidisphaeraceae bacterium]|jgi:hypothetical protein|nr:YdjY domain-containing protein [Tepidisphaeraceae bacterium]
MRALHSLLIVLLMSTGAIAQDVPPSPTTAPADQQQAGGFPGIAVDVAAKQVRVDCETLDVDAPLEFFCVVSGTNEHEAMLRSPIKPSHLHAALLMLGLQPGEPVRYSEATEKWIPPHGPPLTLFVEFEKNGKRQRYPAYRLLRNVKTKQPMPPTTWIFAGSRLLDDNSYAADATGYLVSIVNFNYTVIDIPMLASSANESLSWEINSDLMPPHATKATLVIEPAGAGDVAPPNGSGNADLGTTSTTQPTDDRNTGTRLSDVTVNAAEIDTLQSAWEAAVRPHHAALREAAQAHYDVINSMRREQQRLIDEADRIQRRIDELEKSYQDMTTPRPSAITP